MPSIRLLMAATLAAGLAIVPAARADDWHGYGHGYGGDHYHGFTVTAVITTTATVRVPPLRAD